MSDIAAMETSQESRRGEGAGPLQDEPLKKEEGPVKNKEVSAGTPPDAKAPGENKEDESLGAEEEPGTFDRVYEHGRQMGF